MTKPKSKPTAATHSASRKSNKSRSRKRPAPASSKPVARPGTKHERIIAMLRTPAGATIASLVTATKWQQHSRTEDHTSERQSRRELVCRLLLEKEKGNFFFHDTATTEIHTLSLHDALPIAMLRTPAGATIASLVTATKWQQHSVRGFLAGVIRKKLGLNLVSEQTDKGRVYRIKDGKASLAAADKA